MAISSGAGPHFAWVSVGGGTFLLNDGSASQNATRKSSTFRGELPLNSPGAAAVFGPLGANSASIVVSTRGVEATLIAGEIDSVEFHYRSGLISFSGRDQSAKLHATKSSEKWTNQSGSSIVQQLAGRVGLGFSGDASTLMAGKQTQIEYAKLTEGISYAAVIHRLAELDGARWWVKNGVLHYQSVNNPQGTYTIYWNMGRPESSDCLGLRISRDIQASKGAQVTVKSWHPKKKKVFTGQMSAGGGGVPYVFHIPNLLQDHAQQFATAKANEIANRALQLYAECVGDPTIDVAMGLQLNGTGYFDQTYQIDSIEHTFGMKGHKMWISAKTASSGGGGDGGDSTSTGNDAVTPAPADNGQAASIAQGGTP